MNRGSFTKMMDYMHELENGLCRQCFVAQLESGRYGDDKFVALINRRSNARTLINPFAREHDDLDLDVEPCNFAHHHDFQLYAIGGNVEGIRESLRNYSEWANKYYALQWASKRGHGDIVKLLLEHLKNRTSYWDPCEESLWIAVNTGQTHIVRIILEDGRFDPNIKNCLKGAISVGYKDITELLLLDGRAKVYNNLIDFTDDPICMKLLLEDGRMDPRYKSDSIVRRSLLLGRHKLLEVMLADKRVNIVGARRKQPNGFVWEARKNRDHKGGKILNLCLCERELNFRVVVVLSMHKNECRWKTNIDDVDFLIQAMAFGYDIALIEENMDLMKLSGLFKRLVFT